MKKPISFPSGFNERCKKRLFFAFVRAERQFVVRGIGVFRTSLVSTRDLN